MPEIIDADQASLRRLCNLTDDAPIPEGLVEQYWRARRLISRLGSCGAMSAPTLVAVGLAAGLGALEPKDIVEETFATLVQRGDVKPHERIMVRYRNREREAEFLKIRTDGTVEFQLDDERNPLSCKIANAWKKATV